MSTPGERCEIHGAKRYLPYEEHEGWRAFCDAANPGCPQANYAVLKKAAPEALDAVEAFYAGRGVPFCIEGKPDSAALEQLQPLLKSRGYTVRTRSEWRLMHCLQPSPLLLVHECRIETVTGPLAGAAAELLREQCGGTDAALLLANRQLTSGARAFVAVDRAEVPVSICIGEGYGSAFCITDVFTAEAQRCKGYGAAVVMAMLNYAADPDRGYDDLFVYVEDGPARRLYEKTGFRGKCTQLWRACKEPAPQPAKP